MGKAYGLGLYALKAVACVEPIQRLAKEANLDFTSTASFFNIDGNQGAIPCRAWGNADQANAAIILVHGLNANAGWFEPAGRQFKLNNVYTVAYDQISFGQRKSEVAPNYTDWLQDLENVFCHVQEQMGTRPVFILGNSMGALITASLSYKLKPAGLVFTSPAFAGNPKLFTPLFVLKTLTRTLINPDWKITEPYNIGQVSRSPAAQEQIAKDSGPYLIVPAGIFWQIFLLTKNAYRKIALANCPVLMLTAQHDYIVDNHASMQVFKKLKNMAKVHKEFSDAYHDLLLDPLLEDVTADIIQWMYKGSEQSQPAESQLQLSASESLVSS
jgi:alpha-beta hydrolase superfamily lysophospholipase